MIKLEDIPGADKKDKSSWIDKQRRVMLCDTKGCDGRIEGTGGDSEHTLKSAAYTSGWKRDWRTAKDSCPKCSEPVDDDKAKKK